MDSQDSVTRRQLQRLPAHNMTGAAFRAWQASLGLSQAEAARQLGASANSMPRYRAQGGGRTLALACAAVSARLGPWSPAEAQSLEAVARLREAMRSELQSGHSADHDIVIAT